MQNISSISGLKKICFFVKMREPKMLEYRQWYGNDIRILKELGFRVILAHKFNEIPWDCDLYFSWFVTGSFLPLIKAKLKRKPIIIVAGGSAVARTPFGYFIKPWYVRIIIRLCLKLADAVLAVSNNTMDEIKKLGARNAILLYNAIDTTLFAPTDSTKDIIFTISRQDNYTYEGKKLKLLLRAIALVLYKYPDQRFFIAGENSNSYNKTMLLAKRLGISQNIEFLGLVPNRKTIEYFRRALIYVQPTRYEAFGVAIAEAMSCQAPVITSKVGAVTEVVGDCGLYIKDDDPQDLASKIIYLLENKDVARDLGIRARRRIEEHFNYEKRKEGIKKLINCIF